MIKKLHTFTISYHSDIDDTDYDGQFTSRRMSMMDRSKISVRKAQLNGGYYCVRDEKGVPTGMGIDEETEFMNYALAYLETVILQKPAWWDLQQITDNQVMLKVFEEAMKFENSFRDRGATNNGEGEKGSVPGSQGSSAAQPQKSNDGSAPKKVVDEKVSASLDA